MHSSKPLTVVRLEQALGAWEELMYIAHVVSQGLPNTNQPRLIPKEGPHVHYRELRSHLLSLRSMDDFDQAKFVGTLETEFDALLGGYKILPTMLAGWCANSRRVYHLDRDLQALLMATSLESLVWDDVQAPFESFGISLEEPLKSLDGSTYDFLLVSPLDELDFVSSEDKILPWCLFEFQSRFAHWKPTTLRKALESRVRMGKYFEAAQLASKKGLLKRNLKFLRGSIVSRSHPTSIEDLLTELARDSEKDRWGQTGHLSWRLVIGLCMYLNMLPPESPRIGAWTPSPKLSGRMKSLDTAAITDESQVCTVSSVRTLSREESDTLLRRVTGRATAIEMRAHFRTGHWRRPPGTAHNLEQKKTVWVQPTIVRRDRLPEGGAPGGGQIDLE